MNSKLETVKALVTSKSARTLFKLRKHSPTILFVGGAAGVIATTVLACRATLKVADVLDKHDSIAKEIEKQDGGVDEALRRNNLDAGIQVAKLYAVPALLGVASIAALSGAHVVLTKRHSSVLAAYVALDQAAKRYRGAIVDEFGADVDARIAAGYEKKTIEEKHADGTTSTTESVVKGKFGGSMYAVVFDENSRYFSKEPGRNAATVSQKQAWANDKLRMNGHLFLNEVYDMLGLPRTKAGAIVGWIHRPGDPTYQGVDFQVFRGESEFVEGFINGDYYYCTLDPNVDGSIWDKI